MCRKAHVNDDVLIVVKKSVKDNFSELGLQKLISKGVKLLFEQNQLNLLAPQFVTNCQRFCADELFLRLELEKYYLQNFLGVIFLMPNFVTGFAFWCLRKILMTILFSKTHSFEISDMENWLQSFTTCPKFFMSMSLRLCQHRSPFLQVLSFIKTLAIFVNVVASYLPGRAQLKD